MQLLLAVIEQIAHTLKGVLPITIGMALLFTGLAGMSPCNPGKPWWRKREIIADVCYWFIIPVFGRFARIGLTVLCAVYLLGIRDGNAIVHFFQNGHGPLSLLPLWSQCAIYIVAWDFLHYWTHRLFHRGALWKYHAVHHSSVDLDWISAARFHPFNLLADSIFIDVTLLLCGISPNIFLFVGPFNIFTSAMVHANLSWTFGPLKYVLASPVFHRWHHTLPAEGGERNFAGMFSLFDVIFGTFYMPETHLPSRYGIEDTTMPASLGLQIFTRSSANKASV